MIKLLALAVAGFVLAFIGVFSPLFEIENVIINDDQGCIKDFEQLSQDYLLGNNLIFLDTQQSVQKIQEEFACVDSLSVDKQLLSTVIISVKAKVAVAKIADTNLQITGDGLLVKADDQIQVPTIFLSEEYGLSLNNKIEDNKVITALEITKNLLKSDFVPVTIRIVDDEQIAVYSSKDILVIFSAKKEPISQVDSLQLILAEAKIDATKIDKIDLRFEKPVITYKE